MATSHPIHHVTAFAVIGPHSLDVRFADGVTRTIDFAPVLGGQLFGPLKAPEVFRQVHLDPEVHTLVWPNGADFDPATLHDWPTHASALAERATRWESQIDILRVPRRRVEVELVQGRATAKREGLGQKGISVDLDECTRQNQVLLNLLVCRPGRLGTPGGNVSSGNHSSTSIFWFTRTSQRSSLRAPLLLRPARSGVARGH